MTKDRHTKLQKCMYVSLEGDKILKTSLQNDPWGAREQTSVCLVFVFSIVLLIQQPQHLGRFIV